MGKGKKCIEFRNEYTLKVVNSTHVAFKVSEMKVVSSYQFLSGFPMSVIKL